MFLLIVSKQKGRQAEPDITRGLQLGTTEIVCCLLNILATCECISGTDMLRQLSAVTLRKKLQIKLSTSPSHSILTPGHPIPALTL